MEAQKRAQKASSNIQIVSAGTAPLDKQAHSSGGERKARWVQQWRAGGFVAEWFFLTLFPTVFDSKKKKRTVAQNWLWKDICKSQKIWKYSVLCVCMYLTCNNHSGTLRVRWPNQFSRSSHADVLSWRPSRQGTLRQMRKVPFGILGWHAKPFLLASLAYWLSG